MSRIIINELTKQIQKAQAEAIRNAGSLEEAVSTQTYMKGNAIMQRNLQQEEAARLAAQQKAENEKKAAATISAYDAYQGSEEQKKNQQAANRKALQEAIDRIFAVPGVSASDMPLSVVSPMPVDTKEQELKAAADYYKNQQRAETDRAIMEADLKEYESWSDADKAAMEKYIIDRDRAQSNIFGETQFDTYNLSPIVQSKGIAKVRQMANSLQRSRNEKTAEQVTAAAEKAAAESPVLGSALSVGANLLGSYTGPMEYVKEMANRDSRYTTLDPNNLGSVFSQYGGTVRQGVSQKIEGEDGSWLRKIAAIGYEGVMSAADSAARMAAGGFDSGVSSVIAASGSFGNSLRQYSAQGASPEQAAAAALATSGIEYITEKIPMDKLLKIKDSKSAMRAVLKQAFLVEPTTEEVSLFMNAAAEATILEDKSSQSQRIGELIANGASYEEAREQVNKELWKEAAKTYAVSAVSGSFSAGGAAIIGGKTQTQQEEKAAPVAAEATVEQQTEPVHLTEKERLEKAMEEVTAPIAARMPKQEPVQMTEGKQQLQAALDEVLGVKPTTAQKNTATNGGERNSKKTGSIATPESATPTPLTSETTGGTAPMNSIPETGAEVKGTGAAEATSRWEDIAIAGMRRLVDDVRSGMSQAKLEGKALSYQQQYENLRVNRGAQEGHTETEDGTMRALRFLSSAYSAAAGNPKETADIYQTILDDMDNDASTQGNTGSSFGSNTVGSAQSRFDHRVRKSNVYGNTYENATGKGVREIGAAAKAIDPDIGKYDSISEDESLYNAVLRTRTREDIDFEYSDLLGRNGWSGEDNDTAFRIMHYLRVTGDHERLVELARKQREEATTAGQLAQSFAKYSREDATSAAVDAVLTLDGFDKSEIAEQYYRGQDFESWKKKVNESILSIANEIENVDEGDWNTMHDIVRDLANYRHTTGWFGVSSELTRRTERGLAKMDFDALKSIAKTQLSMIPHDFRKRSAGEVIRAIRVQNMLFTITTKLKNDAGNITNGFMDAVSDSFGGRMIDVMLSKATGQRTVGNDLRYAKEYTRAARDAADVAAAFVSLDIPMESDAKYSTGKTRTFASSTHNWLGRLLSVFEKHMKYELEVSDKFYEGGASHVVSESLWGLGEKSNLNAEQIDDLARKVGARRTFKDPGTKIAGRKTGKLSENGRTLARTNTGVQRALNNIGIEGFGLGDLIQPFGAVSGEVAHVGLDYSGGGLASGLSEIIGILKDARNGTPIDPYRQRTAATNFARGMTGVGLIAAFTGLAAAGAIKVHNSRDYEERMAEQAQGLSGAQWNLHASLRWWESIMKGGNLKAAEKAAEWQYGDELIGMDFLEPFNTQMHIGYLLSQGEDVVTAVAQGNFESLLGMPMMQTFSDLADLTQSFTEVSDGNMDGVYDAFGQLVGNMASSAVPNWMRKTAQTVDPVIRDTYDTDPLAKAGKQITSAIPFVSTKLPAKYDGLGSEQMRFDINNPLEWLKHGVNTLITPWGSQEYKPTAAYQEIGRHNDVEGIDVTPPSASRRVSYTDNQGNVHDKMLLTDEQYQTFAKVQGQTAAKLLNEIIESPDYKALTDQQKAATVKAVYEYSQEQAKKETLPDYHSKADKWMTKVMRNPAEGLINRGAEIILDTAISETVEALANGWKVTEEKKNSMDVAYDTYNSMSEEAQRAIFTSDTLEGNTKKFLEVREQGVTTEQYIEVAGSIARLVADEGYSDVRPAQRYEAIAESSADQDVIDALMKAYMPDGDNTEKKYDYIRNEMGYSPENYAKAYDIYSHEAKVGGDGTADRTRNRMVSELGITMAEAKTLYKLFNGKYKPWEE